MRLWKKALSLVLVSAMAFSMCACGRRTFNIDAFCLNLLRTYLLQVPDFPKRTCYHHYPGKREYPDQYVWCILIQHRQSNLSFCQDINSTYKQCNPGKRKYQYNKWIWFGFSVADYSDQADHKKKLSKQHKKNSRMILQLGTKQHRCNRSQSPDQAKHSNYNSLRIVVLIITHIFPVPLTLLR